MSNLDGLVWHYTDAKGFANIVRSNELWATQMSGLNDTSELQFGCEQVDEACKLAAHWPDVDKIDRDWLEGLTPWFVADDAREQVFVTSASLEGDLLNQWMHYGGGGYSIGFDSKAELGYLLADGRIQQREPGLVHAGDWTDVRYGDDLGLVQSTVRQILHIRNGDSEWSEWEHLAELRTLAATQKHPAFQSELEARYVTSLPLNSDARQYRVSRSGSIVSYVRLVGWEVERGSTVPTARLPIRAVKIGPPQARSAETKTIERFLEDSGYPGIEVSASQIPYRP